MNCAECGDFRLREVGVLGRRVQWRCEACGTESSTAGHSAARLEDLSRQHRMDMGGYCWENAGIEPFASWGCVAWDDPDWDYLMGDAPDGCHGETCVVFWAPGHGEVPWPRTYEVEHEDGPWTYGQAATGVFFERDVECDCSGRVIDSDGCWKYTNNSMDEAHPDCPWCDGDGSYDGEGGAWAAYVLQDDD